jgi:hypothetical protein
VKTLQILALSLVSVFAPASTVLVTVMALSIADLFTGILASRKAGTPITSAGLKKTVVKVLIYEAAVLCAFLVQQNLTGDDLPVMKWLGSLIGLTELKSVLENLDLASGGSFFRSLTDRLSGVISSGGKGDGQP